MEEEKIKQDSFTIGTPSGGGAIKVYFDDIHSEDTARKIDKAIQLWKSVKVLTGKA